MKFYGLTGAPGCGKSKVLELFFNAGWHIIDSDAVCHLLHENSGGRIHCELEKRWGKEVILPSGSTNRQAVAEKIFCSCAERRWLEALILPLILEEIKEEVAVLPEKSAVICEIPLLFEKEIHYSMKFNGIISVWCSSAVQMERLLKRGWSREHALLRINSQLSANVKLERADYGIINDGSLEILRKQCMELDKLLREN